MWFKEDKGFNQDLIDCIDYIMEKTGETSHIHVDIFKKKWGKRRGNELYTFLSSDNI